jgi:hypothetical protein
LGAIVLSDMAKKIEQGARQGALKDPQTLARHAVAEFDRVAKELHQLIQ